MSDLKKNINKIKSAKQSTWKESALYRQNNLWMDYSSQISRRIYALIKDDKKINQDKLADAIGVKPQYISKIMKGKENLTLKTIYKLSKALNFELISFPPYEFTQPIRASRSNTFEMETSQIAGAKVVSFGSVPYKQLKNDK